jgi:hypothetical protein
MLGDAQQVRDSLFVVDVRSGRQQDIALPEGWNTLSEAGVLGWDGHRLYAVIAHFGAPRRLRLVEIDAGSGALRTVLEEAGDTRLQLNLYSYNRPAVAILPGQDTAVWFSQRDGWGHLYRVRLSDGKVLRQLTRGHWAVRDLLGWTLQAAGRTSAPAASTGRSLRTRPVPGIAAGWADPAPGRRWQRPPGRCRHRRAVRRTRAAGAVARRWLSGGYRFRLDQPPRTVLRPAMTVAK